MNAATMARAFQQAAALYDQQRYAEGLDRLDDDRLELYHLERVLLFRALLWWQLDELRPAIGALEHAECLAPLPAEAYCVLAECHLRLGDPRRAKSVLLGLWTGPDLPDSVLGPVARGLYQVGAYTGALAVCRLAAARYPEADEPLWWASRCLEALGRPPEGRASLLLQAFQRAPEETRYPLALAMLYADRLDFAAAYRYALLVPLDGVRCPACLSRLLRVFTAAGDGPRASTCREQCSACEDHPPSSVPPPHDYFSDNQTSETSHATHDPDDVDDPTPRLFALAERPSLRSLLPSPGRS